MPQTQTYRFSQLFWIFIFSMAVVSGPAFMIADTFHHEGNPDIITYLGIAEGDFDQSPVRRYRVIIPWLAEGIHFFLEPVFDRLSPNTFPGDFSKVMSFMLVNHIFMGLWGVALFLITQLYLHKNKIIGGLIGILAILTCRWTIFLTGTPMVDSLFLFLVALFIYGILAKKHWAILAAIYLGPWAKESFIFFVPLLIFAERQKYLHYALHLILSGIIVFSFRYGLDAYVGNQAMESYDSHISHLESVKHALKRMLSFHGIYELLSIPGIWVLSIFYGWYRGWLKASVEGRNKYFWIVFVLVILAQALLSTELARMFLLLAPLVVVWVALAWSHLIESWREAEV